MAAVVAVVTLGLFLVRPGAEQLRARIVQEISLALGRQVEVSSVSLQLLPRPGFDLQNFVVHEDPAFGAEPTLRASEVTAALRLTSLLRGRMEIARLSLSEPSVNLVRNSAGQWNLENLLERADQTHVAPTSKSKAEARPGFPYIEASSARINFKFGQEKKPYTLTDADFSVWQDSENTWGMRLKAQPVRTDFNLSDTGTIRVEGSWQRSASLRETPVQFSLQWNQGQLGQATTLLYGSDQGWRGTIAISATVTGTPRDMLIQSSASIDDFRRYDLDGGGALRLATQCDSHYAPLDNEFSGLSCRSAVGGGFIAVSGSASGNGNVRNYDLEINAKNVPMQAAVVLARHTKKNIPEDLIATGTLDASFGLRRDTGQHGPDIAWTGQGQTHNFGISSAVTGMALSLDRVPFSVSPGDAPNPRRPAHRPKAMLANIPARPHVEVGPFKLSLGRPSPVTVSVWFSRGDYALAIQGEAGIQKLLQLARSTGLPAAQPNADGIAKIDLRVAGSWSAFSSVTTLGEAQLRSVRAEVRGLNQPLEVATANVALLTDAVEVKDVTASLAGATWHGSLALPRQCSVPAQCLVRFNLHADRIETDEWNDLLSKHSRQGPWYRFFAPNAQPGNPYLLGLHATGHLNADRVMVHKLPGAKVSADVDLENGTLRISNLQGAVLGGHHSGKWTADFTAKPPQYTGGGSFQDVDLGQLSQAMHDGWIIGSGNATYSATAAGFTAAELTSSADATLQVTDLQGTLPHIVLDDGLGPLRIIEFTGSVLLQEGKFAVADGKLNSSGGAYQVSGTASLAGVLDLKLERANAGGFTIVGPFAAPSVTQTSPAETQAVLKP